MISKSAGVNLFNWKSEQCGEKPEATSITIKKEGSKLMTNIDSNRAYDIRMDQLRKIL